MACEHEDFHAHVAVARLEDSGNFMADVTIKCSVCDLPFQFVGLEPGLNMAGATVSVDGLEARLAICPQGARPNPMQVMGFGVRKFDG